MSSSRCRASATNHVLSERIGIVFPLIAWDPTVWAYQSSDRDVSTTAVFHASASGVVTSWPGEVQVAQTGNLHIFPLYILDVWMDIIIQVFFMMSFRLHHYDLVLYISSFTICSRHVF